MRSARRIGRGHGRDELSRIGVAWVLDDRGPWADLDDLAEIHHGDAVADSLDDRDIMRDEKEGESHLGLKPHHQVHDARLHRDIERRDRLVRDDQLRREPKRARDGEALALAAREFMRETPRHVGREADLAQKLGDALARLAASRQGHAR